MMPISKLANQYIPAHENNYYGMRMLQVDKIIIHHMAGKSSAEACAKNIFQDPKRYASANYCIGNDGKIVCCVSENCAAGASSNKAADMSGISIEVSNSSLYGDWPVSDAAFKSLVALVADIAKRYNLKLAVGKTLCYHQMYACTACPGPYLIHRLYEICERATALINSNKAHYIDGYDVKRRADQMIFYTDGFYSDTNKYGVECRIINYKVTAIEYGRGHMSLCGGWVLSGHGESANWIRVNIKAGTKVVRRGNTIYIEGVTK